MKREELCKFFSEDKVDKILKMESEGVTFDMLSKGQKTSFIAIARMIDNNFITEKKVNNDQETLMEMIQAKKKHITLNGPAGTK